jgi:tryptophanyl-tRNA synthetase
VTPTPWVERTPSFKEKKRNQPDDVNFALLSYPVLQAADIAIYKARYVPVGKDQAAHLELAREIVRAFNARYGDTFPEPEAVFTDSPIIKGTDGAAKMSKSLGNVIEIFADEEAIRKQVMSMVTDTQRVKRTDPGRPQVCNVCQLHKQFSEDYQDIWEGERTARTGCVDTKKLLASRMLDAFAEAREKRRELEAKPGYVEEVLRAGAEKLRPIAQETLRECHERMGLGPR